MTGLGIPSSHLESASVSDEASSINTPSSAPPTDPIASSSTKVSLLKRVSFAGSNRRCFSEIKEQGISSIAADNQSMPAIHNAVANNLPTSALLNLPIEILRHIGESDPKAALAIRPACKQAELIFSEMVSYIHIEKTEDLDLGLAFFRKTRNEEVVFEAEGIRCTAETFKKLFKEVKHLHLNGVSFTEADIPEECDLAKFKSLHLSADLSWDAIAALLNKILPEELETLSLKFNGLLSAEQIARFPHFPKLKALVIDVPGLSGDAAVAVLKELSPEKLETLSLKFYRTLSVEQIAQLPKFPALKKLEIDAPGLTGSAAVALLKELSPEKLEVLSLKFDGVPSLVQIEEIVQVPKFPKLKVLVIDSHDLTGDTIAALVKQISPEKLETFNVRFYGQLTVEQIKQFPDLSALKNLVIDDRGLLGNAVVALFKNISCEKLETLKVKIVGPLSVEEIAEIAQTPNFPKLKKLWLGGSGFSKVAVALLNKASEKLETLDLSLSKPLSDEQITQLPNFPNLKNFVIHDRSSEGFNVVALVNRVSPEKLKTLQVISYRIIDADGFELLSNLSASKSLMLRNFDHSKDDAVALINKVSLEELETLYLDLMYPPSAEEIKQFSNLPALKNLLLRGRDDGRKFSGAAVVAFLNKASPKNLKTLELSYCDLPSIKEIAQLSESFELKKITVSNPAFFRFVFPFVFPFSRGTLSGLFNKISTQYVETLALTDVFSLSVDEIARLPQFPALKTLMLAESKLSGAAIAALLHKASPEKLEALNLNFCGPLSIKNINAFPNFTALQTASVLGVEYAPSKVKQVKQYFFNQAAQSSQDYSDRAEQALRQKLNPNGLVTMRM